MFGNDSEASPMTCRCRHVNLQYDVQQAAGLNLGLIISNHKKMMVILERVEPHDMEVMVAEGYAWRISQLIHLPSVRIKQ